MRHPALVDLQDKVYTHTQNLAHNRLNFAATADPFIPKFTSFIYVLSHTKAVQA